MPPKIIFKQRHRDTKKQGKPFSPADNASHLQYIGEREGVLRTGEPENHLQYIGKRPGTLDTEDMNNGLFGYINGAFVPSTALSAAQSHIRKVSNRRLDIFRCVFSFTPESAAEAGLNSLADWQRFVTSSMNRVAQNMDMKLQSVEWYASVHLKEGQPHIHIMYWDLNQKVRHNKLDPKICDKIRIDVIKDTYHSQFTQLRQRENELMKQMRTEVSSTAQNALQLRDPNEYINTAAKMLNSIYSKLPPKGQLVYAYMPQELKAEIDQLTHFIIDNNEQAAQLYSELLHTRQIYNEMLHSPDTNWGRYNLAKYKYRLCEDIDTRMGNIILKALSQEKKHNKTVLDNGLFHSDSYEPPVIPDEPQEEEAYFESILGAAYYYSDTLRDTDKAKELLEHAEQNGCEYATILLNRIDEHERNAVDNLLRSLMTLLNSAEQHTNAEFYQASKLLFGRGDLSKEMIAELIYKRQDKENTSQR